MAKIDELKIKGEALAARIEAAKVENLSDLETQAAANRKAIESAEAKQAAALAAAKNTLAAIEKQGAPLIDEIFSDFLTLTRKVALYTGLLQRERILTDQWHLSPSLKDYSLTGPLLAAARELHVRMSTSNSLAKGKDSKLATWVAELKKVLS